MLAFLVTVSIGFFVFYTVGIAGAQRKRYTVKKHSLPRIIKYILFLWLPDKYTLNVIIYQAVIVVMTMVTIIFGLLGYQFVLLLYYGLGLVLCLGEGIYLLWLDRIDR